MLKDPISTFKEWRVRRLNVRIAKLRGKQWAELYVDRYSREQLHQFSIKPLYFTDKRSLQDFIDRVKGGQDMEARIGMPLQKEATGDDAVEKYVSLPPGERKELRITFRSPGEEREATICFKARHGRRKAITTVDGPANLVDAIELSCPDLTEGMGPVRRRRAVPVIEPLDSREESDRRNSAELNWRNTLLPAVLGFIGGVLSLLAKAVLQI